MFYSALPNGNNVAPGPTTGQNINVAVATSITFAQLVSGTEGISGISIPVYPYYQTYDLMVGATGGQLLTSHTDNFGHTWVDYTPITGDTDSTGILSSATLGTSYLYGSTGNIVASCICLNSLTPASANYTVGAQFTSATTTCSARLYARANQSVKTDYFIYAGVTSEALALGLFKQVAGVQTQIGTYYIGTWASGTTYDITLTVGTNSQVVKVNGVVVAGPQGTDTAITAAGQAGIGLSGGSSMKAVNFYVQ
jgi:hypothetical protein